MTRIARLATVIEKLEGIVSGLKGLRDAGIDEHELQTLAFELGFAQAALDDVVHHKADIEELPIPEWLKKPVKRKAGHDQPAAPAKPSRPRKEPERVDDAALKHTARMEELHLF